MNLFFSHKDHTGRRCLTLLVSRDHYHPPVRRLLNTASVAGAPTRERTSPKDTSLHAAPFHRYIESTWTLADSNGLGSLIHLLIHHQGAEMLSQQDYADRSFLDPEMAEVERLLAPDGKPMVDTEINF